jgi:peptidoglycan glycosyltransferase
LYENKISEAKILFPRLEGSLWVKNQARLGSIITGILSNNKHNNAPLPEKGTITIDHYHLPSLLRRQLVSSDFNRCTQLAKIGKYYKMEAADLYNSAALLENGKLEEAFRCYSGLSDRSKKTFLGNSLKETFELLHAGAHSIIRDRTGKLVGTIGAERQFRFYRPQYRSFIQPVIIREIRNHEIQKGVRLSIDMELSRLALESLGENQGSIVLIQPDTGEILAAVSDEKTREKMGEGSSPAYEQMLEPASILKLITITAAFRNKLDPVREIAGMTCRGAKRYSGKILYCPAAQGELYGLEHALAVSCNTAFADLGVKIGWEKMLEELRLFGFDSQVKNPFPLGKIMIKKGDNRALADLAIGLENTVLTPVHAVLTAAVFANDGSWVYPELSYATDGFVGLSPKKLKIRNLKGVKILDENWLPAIREGMWAVTRYGGTAGFIAPIGFQVYMKTGTSGSYRDGYHVNYIGYVPKDQGNIAFCVRVTNKRTSFRVRRAAYQTNRELLIRLQQLAAQRGVNWQPKTKN